MTLKFVFLWNLKADFILGWWSNHHCPVSHDEYSYQTHREWMVQILEDSEVNSSRQIARADPDEKYQHVSSRVPLFLWYPQTWAESSGRHHVVLGQEWEREFLTFTESKFSFFSPCSFSMFQESQIPLWCRSCGINSGSKSIRCVNSVCVCVHAQVLHLCPALYDPKDCSLSDSSVHGIFLGRILEWVAMPSSRGSSLPRDRNSVSCITGGFFTTEPLRKPQTLRQQNLRLQLEMRMGQSRMGFFFSVSSYWLTPEVGTVVKSVRQSRETRAQLPGQKSKS